MTTYDQPRINTPDGAAQTPSPPTAATAVPALVGVTQKGPFGATSVTSWPDFRKRFGGFVASHWLPLMVWAIFQQVKNAEVLISRVVHYTDPSNPATKQSAAATGTITTTGAATQGSVTSGNAAPFALEPDDTLVVKIDGGAADTATFTATAASRTGSGGSYPTGFTGGETLLVKVDGGAVQTITFSSAAQLADDVADEVNEQIVGASASVDGGELKITSDRKGTGSFVEVTGGSGAGTLGMAVGSTQGTGNVSNISSVTGAEVKTIVEAAVADCVVSSEVGGQVTLKTTTVGDSGSIQIDATSTADEAAKMDLDNDLHEGSAAGAGNTGSLVAASDGTHGDALKARIAAATSGDTDRFSWTTLRDGLPVDGESWDELITDPDDPRYWETVVNHPVTGSKELILTDLEAGAPPSNRPTNGDYSLSGGDDGLTGLVDADFKGDATGKTGLHAYDDTEHATIPYIPGRTSADVIKYLADWTEAYQSGQGLAVVESVDTYSAEQQRDFARTNGLYQYSKFAAGYWPWAKIVNPDPNVYTSDADGNITCPPGGFAVGRYCWIDANVEGGVHKAPAGPERGVMKGVVGFATDEIKNPTARAKVWSVNWNPLSVYTGAPPHIDGPKLLKTDSVFPSVGERRGVSYIARLIRLILKPWLHRQNTPDNRLAIKGQIEAVLRAEMNVGAFATKVEATAFHVDLSDDLNPPEVVAQNRLVGLVQLAKGKPIYYIDIPIAENLLLGQ